MDMQGSTLLMQTDTFCSIPFKPLFLGSPKQERGRSLPFQQRDTLLSFHNLSPALPSSLNTFLPSPLSSFLVFMSGVSSVPRGGLHHTDCEFLDTRELSHLSSNVKDTGRTD